MKQKYSDFKIVSITIIAVLIFFTISYFKFIPLSLLNINISNFSDITKNYYFILTELIAVLLSVLFALNYSKKTDIELKKRYKSISIGLGVILFYFIFPYFQAIPFILLGSNPSGLPLILKIIYLIAFLSITAAIIVLIYQKTIQKDWKEFKKNSNNFFKQNIKTYLISIAIMFISNFLIQTLVKGGLAGNEQSIRNSFKEAPIYMFFSAVIYAPIAEELVFRLSIKKIFSNKWLFIIISGLLFGFLHVMTDFNNITDLLFIIPYSTSGISFAYMLQKSNNIIVPISFHMIHNGIMISLLTLIYLI